MQILAGIDEAGYGPLLGPLCIVCTALRCDDVATVDAQLRALGVEDSKRLYSRGKLAGLETVALAAIRWLSGWEPGNAEECFCLLGDAPEQRQADWQAAAADLKLPLAASEIPHWELTAEPAMLAARICHPQSINACYRGGGNRASYEADQVASLIAALPADVRRRIQVDRLGGRRYYSELLACAFPLSPLDIITEEGACSSYRLPDAGIDIAFTVKADRDHAICALASCIAKYSRELHMHLFNRYWCKRFPWLKATAGYPEDAKRWLYQIGRGLVDAHADELLRGDADRYLGPSDAVKT